MEIFDDGWRRNVLDLFRCSSFNDADQLLSKILLAAHGQGKVDGAQEIVANLRAVAEVQVQEPQYAAPAPTEELERDIRETVLAKFRPRGDLQDAGT